MIDLEARYKEINTKYSNNRDKRIEMTLGLLIEAFTELNRLWDEGVSKLPASVAEKD